jgi:3-oxoacyl-[acyl-carrier protein] reductase
VTDTYLTLVNTGVTKTIAKRLGLPRPTPLRRYRPGQPLVAGPVLVLHDAASALDADVVADALVGWDLDVRRHAASAERYAAVVLVLTEATHPGDLSAPVLAAAGMLRSLAPAGRVVTLSRPASAGDAPAVAAARQGVDGLLRSIAKELRGGATGNGVVVADGVDVDAPSVLGALRFFLSTRSAFVDGQLLAVDTAAGSLPAAWDRPLDGRVAVVTGAARGIGAAIAATLARDGATVVAVDVPAAGESLARVANSVRGSALQLDITAPDAGERILEHTLSRHGRLDVVVHNAGITRDKLLANMTPDRWDSVLAVNIAAQLRIDEALLAARGTRAGVLADAPRIVSLASTSGIAGNRGQTSYAASKGGVIGLVRATAPLLTDGGGTANAVAPGFIETEMTARIPAVTRQVARRLNSLQQGGQPVDVAEAVGFLASPQAGGVVGRTLRVCGQNMVGA